MACGPTIFPQFPFLAISILYFNYYSIIFILSLLQFLQQKSWEPS